MVAASLDNMHNTIVVWPPSQKSSILFRTSIPPPEAERGGVNLKLNHTTSKRRSHTLICAKLTAYKLKSVIPVRSLILRLKPVLSMVDQTGRSPFGTLVIQPQESRMFAPIHARRLKASVFSRHVSTADSIAPSFFLHGFSCSSFIPPYHVYRTQDF